MRLAGNETPAGNGTAAGNGVPAGSGRFAGPGLAGTVRDAGGRPVAGAVVTVTSAEGRQLARAVTAPEGGYRITGTPAAALTVIVTARGHEPAAAALLAQPGSVIERDFALAAEPGVSRTVPAVPPGREVHGTIRAPGGAAVPGILVTAANAAGEIVASATTDADGWYRLTGLGDGEHVLVAGGHEPVRASVDVHGGETAPVTVRVGSSPAAPAARVPAAAPGVPAGAPADPALAPAALASPAPAAQTEVRHDVVLRGGSGVAGTVRASSGQPVGGATVTVADGHGDIAGVTTTSSDGSFRLAHLADGQYALVVAAAPYTPVAVQVAVRQGELARRDVQLPASGRVAGTVLTADGDRPFPGAHLRLVNEAGAEVAISAADTGGRFVLGDVPPGRYTLVASGYRPGMAALPAGGGSFRQADITLARPE